jgi:hypothetical protein
VPFPTSLVDYVDAIFNVFQVTNLEEGLRGGWFSAKVLQVREGEAYVQYDELLTDDGNNGPMQL